MAAARTSKVRHVFGTPAEPTGCYNNIVSRPSSSESNPIQANDLYFAIPWSRQGSVAIFRHEETGSGPEERPVIQQEEAVNELALHPFVNDILVTVANEATRLWRIPEGGPTMDITAPIAEFQGHDKRILGCDFHPSAGDVLCTWGADKLVKMWDISNAGSPQERLTFPDNHKGLITSLAWSYDGSQCATACKDKFLRIFDPRGNSMVAEVADHQGAKGGRAIWLGNTPNILSVGFTKSVEREIHVFDSRNMSASIASVKIDQTPSSLIPIFDEDTNLLYLPARGDGNIRIFEVFNEAPWVQQVNEFKSKDPLVGIAQLPKTKLNTKTVEVNRFLKLTNQQVVPIRFQIPRQNSEFVFQEDLYPMTRTRVAAVDGNSWFNGAAAPPSLISLKPTQ